MAGMVTIVVLLLPLQLVATILTVCIIIIVGYSDWSTCSAGGDWTEAWTDSDGVVDWSSTIILWVLPLHCEGHTVLTILPNSVGRGPRRRGRTCVRKLYKNKQTRKQT